MTHVTEEAVERGRAADRAIYRRIVPHDRRGAVGPAPALVTVSSRRRLTRGGVLRIVTDVTSRSEESSAQLSETRGEAVTLIAEFEHDPSHPPVLAADTGAREVDCREVRVGEHQQVEVALNPVGQ